MYSRVVDVLVADVAIVVVYIFWILYLELDTIDTDHLMSFLFIILLLLRNNSSYFGRLSIGLRTRELLIAWI